MIRSREMTAHTLREDAILAVGQSAAAVQAWRFKGALNLTVIVKASFAFTHETTMQRTAPQAIVRSEVHHGQNPAHSVRLTTDLVPYLGAAEVLFTGHAYAPSDAPVESLPVRLAVFDGSRPVLEKTLIARRPGGFHQLPMTYEHAFGGTHEGFAPIGQGWGARKRLTSVMPRGWLEAAVVELPDDFAWEYFQAAPPDQRVPELRGDEWIVLDGLHPTLPSIRMLLPGARGLARIHGLSAHGIPEDRALPLKADVLRIDGDEQRCTLTFRGVFPIPSAAALGSLRVAAGVEVAGRPIQWPDLAAPPAPRAGRSSSSSNAIAGTVALDPEGANAFTPRVALPFHKSQPPQASVDGTLELAGEDAARRPSLPFQHRSPTSPPPPQRISTPAPFAGQTVALAEGADAPAIEPALAASTPEAPAPKAPPLQTSKKGLIGRFRSRGGT